MSRRQAAAFALVDVAFLADPGFRRLARLLPDPDELNSAIGAYFVALAASRRNGNPAIDVSAETDSRFVPQLREAGLLVDDGFPPEAWAAWAPKPPQQANAGRGRADQAAEEPGGGRDPGGRFAKVTSGTSALVESASVTSALEALDQRHQPSPPLPSTPTGTGRGEPRSSKRSQPTCRAREAVAEPPAKPSATKQRTFDRATFERATADWDEGRFGSEWAGLRSAMSERGCPWPPKGGPDDDRDADRPSQRAILHHALEDYPTALLGIVRRSRDWGEVVRAVIGLESDMRAVVSATEERESVARHSPQRGATTGGLVPAIKLEAKP